MIGSRSLIAAVMLAVLLSGCATTGGDYYDNWKNCALSGAVTGGVAGLVIEDDAAIVAAIAGAFIGNAICARRDSDGDGVRNGNDNCPETPAGIIVDANGCALDSALDSDGDGVADSADACPGTPAGATVDARGCQPDSDGDGVVNSRDECPGTPAGTNVGVNGCELDSDSDGVVNSRDACPATAAGAPVDNQGCAIAESYTLEGVNFYTDSDVLTEDSSAKLDDAVEILIRYPELPVEIAGHTDSQGSEVYNQDLSERRAAAVYEYLVSHGANEQTLTIAGYGESQPIADNGNEVGRAANRRVELRH